MLQHVGAVANFLMTSGAAAKTAHPDLWEKAQAEMIAANEHPADRRKGEAAWLSVYNLLSAAGMISDR